MNDLTIIVPTLNEENNIGILLEELNSLYPDINVFVVDDNSSDTTAEIVREKSNVLSIKVSLIIRKSSPGLTASVLDGICAVKTDYFAVMDGDLQHPPSVIEKLYEKVKINDLVVGARIPYNENQGFHRILFTRFATFLAKMFLKIKGNKVADPMSGLFCGRTVLFQENANKDLFELAGYKVLFDYLKILKEIKTDNVYYQFQFRRGGKSKLKPAHAFYFMRSLFTKVSWRS